MPPKRKSNAIEADVSAGEDAEQVVKKPRVSDAPEASGSKDKKAKQAAETKDWHEIVLEGEGEVCPYFCARTRNDSETCRRAHRMVECLSSEYNLLDAFRDVLMSW